MFSPDLSLEAFPPEDFLSVGPDTWAADRVGGSRVVGMEWIPLIPAYIYEELKEHPAFEQFPEPLIDREGVRCKAVQVDLPGYLSLDFKLVV